MSTMTIRCAAMRRHSPSVANLGAQLIALAGLIAMTGPVLAQANFQRLGPDTKTGAAFSYIGVVEQHDKDFTTFGYLTHLNGLPDELLFFGAGERDQRNARFTFHSRTSMANKSVLNQVFSVGVEGQMNLFMRSAPLVDADFSLDSDFQAGTQIASMTIRGRSVVVVTAPNFGVNSATLQLTQTPDVWGGFKIANQGYAFGLPGARMQMTHIGRGEKSQDDPVIATITIAGTATAVADTKDVTTVFVPE